MQNMQNTLYDVAKAAHVAAKLNDEDTDGWSYDIEILGIYARISVFDNDHQFLGYL